MTGSVFVAGGGTGGHVFPSLAVAGALREAAPDLAVEFVGTARGLESRLVPEAGWVLHTVEAMPLARKVSASTLKVPFALRRAVRSVRALLRERKAVAAIVFGGYVSVPLALAAWRERLPLVVHEQNAVPGVANRLAARWASSVAVTFPGTTFGKTHVEVTGNPVRPGLDTDAIATARTEALAAFDLAADRRTLLVFGGSQGARSINEAILTSAALWSSPERLQILHVAGRRDAEDVIARWAKLGDVEGVPVVRCRNFVERMDLAYATADAVVCRAGASTIAELTVLGLPSVLVPYPHATADHQSANARALARAGGAVMVADPELDAQRLVDEAQPLLIDDEVRARVSAAARAFGRPDAAARVAELVLAAAGRAAATREDPSS